ITTGQPAAPSYFTVNAGMNKRSHPLLDPARRIPPMTAAEMRAALDDGVGVVADVGERIALITYPGEEQAAALRLARIGSDNAIGYLNVDRDGAFPAELSSLVRQGTRVSSEELDRLMAADAVTVVDVRNPGEHEVGTIPAAILMPLAHLRSRLDELQTTKPIVVYCAGGWRSSVAASMLRAHGFTDVSDLAGGYNAWADCPSTV